MFIFITLTWDLQICVVQIESKKLAYKLKLKFVFKNLNSEFKNITDRQSDFFLELLTEPKICVQ